MIKFRTAKMTRIVLAAIMAMSVYGTAFAGSKDKDDDSEELTNTRGRVEDVHYTSTTDASGLKDPNITHPILSHDASCGEYVHDTTLTIGDLNKVVDDLVTNDRKLDGDIKAETKARTEADSVLNQKITAEATARANGDIVSGSVVDNSIVLTKGDNTTITIDASSLAGAKEDTYVTDGTYDSDSQVITLERNNGKEDIKIQLDNIAKADDVSNLENRVTTNETNISNLQGDVTNIKTDITNIEGDVSNLENRVTTNETNISNLQGDVTNIKTDITNIEGDVSDLENRVTTNETNISNLQGDVTNIKTDITNIEGDVSNLENRVTTNETNISNLQGDVTNIKTDITNIEGDVSNLENRVTTNETNISNLQGDVTNIKTDITNIEGDVSNLEKRVSTNETNISNLQGNVTDLSNRVTNVESDTIKDANFANNTITLNRVSGENAISIEGVASVTDVQNEENARKDADDALNGRINKEIADRDAADKILSGEDIASGHMNGNTLVLEKNNQKTVEVTGIATTGDISDLQTQVSDNRTEIQNNKEKIEKETSERKAEDARLDGRIDGVEQSVSDLSGRIDRLDGKINKGVALAIAHASLKPLDYDPQYKWTGAIGVGSYHGENAVAAGAFYQANKDLMFNISISACGSEKGIGGGVSVRFK